MTPERRKEIESGKASPWYAIRECLREIDKLKKEVDCYKKSSAWAAEIERIVRDYDDGPELLPDKMRGFFSEREDLLEEIDRLRNNKEHLETGLSIQEKLRKARALLEEIAGGKCGSDDARAYLDEAEK